MQVLREQTAYNSYMGQAGKLKGLEQRLLCLILGGGIGSGQREPFLAPCLMH